MKRVTAFIFVFLAAGIFFAYAANDFQIVQPVITDGSNRSNSANFVIQGCISIGPGGGTSSSESFLLQSGCAVLYLNKDNQPQKPNKGEAGKIGNKAPEGKAGQIDSQSHP